MNVFKAIGHAFVVTGKALGKAFKAAKSNALSDALVQSLLDQYVPKAAVLWPDDNDARREWVVKTALSASKGKIQESTIRLALELAVQAAKAKDKPEDATDQPPAEPLPPPVE